MLAAERIRNLQNRFCSIYSCIIAFSVVTLVFLSTSLLCMILFQTQVNGNTPILITSSATYQIQNNNVVLACAYPARDFIADSTDKQCSEPTFYCPASYSCENSNSNVPVCYSDTMSCENSTFCYDYINTLPFTSDDMAKQLNLTFNFGSIVFFYASAVIGVILFVGILIVSIVFRERISWVPEGAESGTNPESEKLSGSGPNLKFYDSYSHILGEEEEDSEPWSSRELILASVIGGIGALLSLGIIIGMSIAAATMEPSLPSIDEIVEYECLSDSSEIDSMRWRISSNVVFTILASLCVIVVALLLISSQVKRVYQSIWNAKACCYLWGIIIALFASVAILAGFIAIA